MRRPVRHTIAVLAASLAFATGAPASATDVTEVTGVATGFFAAAGGWKAAPPPAADDATCVPALDVDHPTPKVTNQQFRSDHVSADIYAPASAYVWRGQCGSVSVIAAFRVTRSNAAGRPVEQTPWHYIYGEDLVRHVNHVEAIVSYLVPDHAAGLLLVQTGAWWGRAQMVNGQRKVVYRPAGCIEDGWIYDIVTGFSEERHVIREAPCHQPPLPNSVAETLL